MTVFRNWSRVAIAAGVALFSMVATAPAEERESNGVSPSAVVVPSMLTFGFNLPAGGVSAPVTVPANVPVQLMGITTTLNFRGIGQAALLRISGAGGFLEWVGLDSTAGAAITQGFSALPGTKILFIDFAHQVRIEVANASAIQIRNTSAAPRAGRVTLTW